MISGSPPEARWVRAEPRREFAISVIERIARRALGEGRVLQVEPLMHGYRNANFKVRTEGGNDCFVVRIYEHDPSLCRKEADLIRRIASSVPVPEIIAAEANDGEDVPPFAVLRFVEGTSFHDLKRGGDRESIAQAAFSAGETLAAIGRFCFPRSGWIGPGPEVTAPMLEGDHPAPRFVDLCLASPNLQKRMPEQMRDAVHARVWSICAEQAFADAQPSLVHGDFGQRNILVHERRGRWTVAAILDWEFAIAASQLNDVGHFLRYECTAHPMREPHFAQGFLHGGGTLPEDWRAHSRLLDMIALVESLTHDDLPAPIVGELIELVRATVEERDPDVE